MKRASVTRWSERLLQKLLVATGVLLTVWLLPLHFYWAQSSEHRRQPLWSASQVQAADEGSSSAPLDSGIRLEVAPWVPPRDSSGWWGVTRTGEAPSKPLHSTKDADTLRLPPETYDVYWVQDYDTSGRPLLLASGVKVEPGRVTTVSANSGIQLEVAPWVPPRDNSGWWGVTRAGEAPDKRLHWSKTADSLVLPPGTYDVYWVQDYDTSGKPLLLASGIRVEAGQLEKVSTTSGIQLEVASWVPPRDKSNGWWGVTRAGEGPDKRVQWTKTAESLVLPPGTYDVYWVQDYDNSGKPMLLASAVKVEPGQLATSSAASGVRLTFAAKPPALAPNYGWWGVVRAGGGPDARVQWSRRIDQPLLVPPGSYDIFWQQKYEHEPNPIKHAVTVQDDQLLEVHLHPSRALFLGADPVTRGAWPGVYGSEGFILVSYNDRGQDLANLPTYLGSYAFSRSAGFRVWSKNTAAAGSFSLTLTPRDAAPHTLALYFVDWDMSAHPQKIVVYDAATNEMLDQRTLTDLHDGMYYLYEAQGSIRVECTRIGGGEAVLSGVFWDPFNPAKEPEILAALTEASDGGRQDAVLTVRRGEETVLFTLVGAEEAEASQPAEPPSEGLTGRYLTGSGYGRLLVERQDPGVKFAWWQDGADKFPEESAPPGEEPLWAEWEGEVSVPREESEHVISLAKGASLGISLGSSEAGIRIERMDSGSAAEAGGLQVGDIITRVLGKHIRNVREVAFRLEAPGGGYLFVDGRRLLAKITCVAIDFPECTTPPQLEASRMLAVGKHLVRMAAVRRGSKEAAAAEQSAQPPIGPLLSWRLPGAKDFEPVPGQALRPRPRPGVWSRTPRQAAQVGLDWLQSTAVAWQEEHKCYGCHVQSQALMGMAIARANDYRVSDEAYFTLLNGIASFQKDNGAWHNGSYVAAAQFGAMALAVAAHRGKEGRNDTLMRAVHFLLKAQQQDGRVILDQTLPPIMQGDIQATANARIAFSLAAKLAPPTEASDIERAEKQALRWLPTAELKTNQDRAMRILGLATEDPEDRKGIREPLELAKADLLKHQLQDGGWAEEDSKGSNAFATGQALYALRVAGQSIASAPYQRGVQWLLQHQLWTGAWPLQNTHSRTQYAPTMWPVIALVGSFGGMVVEVAEPAEGTCMQGPVSLAARVVTQKRVDLVRFLIDGREVGTTQQASGEGVYRVPWDAGTVSAGLHEVRAEAVRDGKARGEDQTTVYTSATAGQCSGSLSVTATQELMTGVLAPPQIELILDASGSMKQRVDGRPKIDTAKEAMGQIIQGLPDDVGVALRIYGHRIRERQPGDCQDSELVFPFGKIDKARLLERVRTVRALGTTPIAYSLQQVERDFGSAPGEKIVVLVTDGIEECRGNPAAAVSELLAKGVKVRLNIVGFALAGKTAKREMQRIAEITGGQFFDARGTKDLLQGIQRALVAPYDVLDASGKRVSGGRLGEKAIALPVGTYAVVVHASGEPITIANVQVAYNQLTKVELKKEGQAVGTRVVRVAP